MAQRGAFRRAAPGACIRHVSRLVGRGRTTPSAAHAPDRRWPALSMSWASI